VVQSQPTRATQSSDSPLRIERIPAGYIVRGEYVSVFRPTLNEARAAREILATNPRVHGLPAQLPHLPDRSSRPPGAVIYGPVRSRRLGRSLGVNLMRPGRTVCSFHCVYCEYTRVQCPYPFGDWPSPGGVRQALARALLDCGPLDSITISGVGEPTEHPHFEVVVSAILGEARRQRPRVPVRILTNGANTVHPGVRRALDRLDERIVTVDAAPRRVDRPDAQSPLGGVLQGIALLRDFTAQSCFFEGAVSNVEDEAVNEWAECLGELRPRRVQIFTLSRRPAAVDVRPVSGAQLEEIACVLRERSGIEAVVFR
jgi:wyosine [tRNA(Phe)-imidazoG37] synthetase (radical SAM superfamily)